MKIVAIIDNDNFDKKFLVELNSNELVSMTGLSSDTFKKNYTKEIVGKEYNISDVLAAAKVVQAIALGDNYDSILSKQKNLLRYMEKLQRPMLEIQERLKQVVKQ